MVGRMGLVLYALFLLLSSCCSAVQPAVQSGVVVAARPRRLAAKKRPGVKPPVTLRQHALAGAIARCVAQTAVHPLNVAKTLLQTKGGPDVLRAVLKDPFAASAQNILLRGLSAQALLSLPNGALNFMVMEGSRRIINSLLDEFGATPNRQLVDLLSASFGTATATLVSLPQSILNDQIMAGAHRNLGDAIRAVGVRGLYPRKTWTAAIVAKVPAYSLNWAVYQQIRRWRLRTKKKVEPFVDLLPASSGIGITKSSHNNININIIKKNTTATTTNTTTTDNEQQQPKLFSPMEDMVIGAVASSLSVCIMIPFDTIKVRMTTNNIGSVPYNSVADALRRMLAEEGALSLYRGLPPRLLSVVPMTAIQFAAYEICKRRIPDIENALRASLAHATRPLLRHAQNIISPEEQQQQQQQQKQQQKRNQLPVRAQSQ